jgi:ABC-2 type transport system permease protein
MKIILNIIRKEFIQLRQDKKMFGISFLAPILQLLILGYAASLDVSEIPLIVCDMDHSAESRNMADHFTANGSFSIRGSSHSERIRKKAGEWNSCTASGHCRRN